MHQNLTWLYLSMSPQIVNRHNLSRLLHLQPVGMCVLEHKITSVEARNGSVCSSMFWLCRILLCVDDHDFLILNFKTSHSIKLFYSIKKSRFVSSFHLSVTAGLDGYREWKQTQKIQVIMFCFLYLTKTEALAEFQ